LKLQITVEGKTYEVEVEVLEEDEGARTAGYGQYQSFAAPPPMTFPAPPLPAPDGNIAAGKVCCSPVTGLVIKVNIVPGQQVQPDELIVVLEAMKMETNVTAPCASTVRSVNVAPGDSVKVNQVIVEFE
jgi:methylmalonyl-CoA carboxyltransferase small subunit